LGLIRCVICQKLLQPSLIIPADFGNNKGSFRQAYEALILLYYLTFSFFMKYMCKTCQKPCNDIIEHIKKVHGFSESYIRDVVITKSDSYLHGFEKIK